MDLADKAKQKVLEDLLAALSDRTTSRLSKKEPAVEAPVEDEVVDEAEVPEEVLEDEPVMEEKVTVVTDEDPEDILKKLRELLSGEE